jgi:hypothetical protein
MMGPQVSLQILDLKSRWPSTTTYFTFIRPMRQLYMAVLLSIDDRFVTVI